MNFLPVAILAALISAEAPLCNDWLYTSGALKKVAQSTVKPDFQYSTEPSKLGQEFEKLAIIVPGEGDVDIDGSSPPFLMMGTYRKIAEGLASHGVATIRYRQISRRYCYVAAGLTSDDTGCVLPLDARIKNLREVINESVEKYSAKCIWLIGHSFGGWVVVEAARSNSSVCGIILLGTLARPYSSNLISRFREEEELETFAEELEGLLYGVLQTRDIPRYDIGLPLSSIINKGRIEHLIQALSYDVSSSVKEVEHCILVAHGENDLQVKVEDAFKFRDWNDRSKILIIPSVGHFFNESLPDSTNPFEKFGFWDRPVSPVLIEGIADFVLSGCGSSE